MADYYIAISHKIKTVLVRDGISDRRICVVPSGIDPQRFQETTGDHLLSEFGFEAGEKIVINVAHLAGHKGQRYLVEAIPHVLAQMPNTRFFIVGDGELMAALKAQAFALGLNRELVFPGFRRDVGAFYKIADLFVMSSIQEGLGTAVLDALAVGVPVVATDSGGIPEYIRNGETGRLVPAADPVALADGIIDMLNHPQKAHKMGERGKAMVQRNFSIEVMAEKTVDIYRQLAASRG